jgi:hypothetical protein
MRLYLAILALALSLAAAAPAMADDDYRGNRLNVPSSQWLSQSEIRDRLEAKGLKVREIEADDGAYEVEAFDDKGVKNEFHVHPATGEILRGYDD